MNGKHNNLTKEQINFLYNFPLSKLADLPYSEKIIQEYYSTKNQIQNTAKEVILKNKIENLRINLENKLCKLSNQIKPNIEEEDLKNYIKEIYKISYIYSVFNLNSATFATIQSSTLQNAEEILSKKYKQTCTNIVIHNNKINPQYQEIPKTTQDKLIEKTKVYSLKFLKFLKNSLK
ncbi:MAG: hypothetical protein AB7V77_02310 [Candidatus Woesearchaeota archaeon]